MKKSEINFFIKNGFLKIRRQQNKFLYLKNKIKDIARKELNLKKINLDKFHTKIEIENLNNFKLKVFKKINEILKLNKFNR